MDTGVGDSDSIDALNYARELQERQLFEQAIPYYEHFLGTGDGDAELRLLALHHLASCYYMSGNLDMEWQCTLRSLEIDIPRPEFICRIAERFLGRSMFSQAAFWYHLALSIPGTPNSQSIDNSAFRTWLPHKQLGLCYFHLGDYRRSLEHNRQAQVLAPGDIDIRTNIALLESLIHDELAVATATAVPGPVAISFDGHGTHHRIIVIVPYRPDNGHRDQLWAFLRGNYWSHLPFPVVIGHHLDGPFNRSRAVNRAAEGAWDFAIIADSDTWVPGEQLQKACLEAQATGRLTAAFNAVAELSPSCTKRLLDGTLHLTDVSAFSVTTVRRHDLETQSSMLVMPRSVWDRIGGMDERFVGWGGEDNALWKAATVVAGQPARIGGNAFHMWHPPAESKHDGRQYGANLKLWQLYHAARTEEDLRRIAEATSPLTDEPPGT